MKKFTIIIALIALLLIDLQWQKREKEEVLNALMYPENYLVYEVNGELDYWKKDNKNVTTWDNVEITAWDNVTK